MDHTTSDTTHVCVRFPFRVYAKRRRPIAHATCGRPALGCSHGVLGGEVGVVGVVGEVLVVFMRFSVGW